MSTAVEDLRFGVTLGNRDLVHGILGAGDLLDMASRTEACELVDSLWVGDSLLAQPRLESLTLLAALAARTDRVLLGTACMGSFTLRDPVLLADQWASLDQLADGRTVLVACTGGRTGAIEAEARSLGVATRQRRGLMLEGIEVVRALFSGEPVTYHGTHHHLDAVTVLPRPLQDPPPIWVASNPAGRTPEALQRSLADLAAVADGWMTHSTPPEEFEKRWTIFRAAAEEAGRDGDALGNSFYYNINVDEDRETALANAGAYLERYYGTTFSREKVETWCALGSPEACAADLRRFAGSGVQRITLRICSDDPAAQLERVLDEVLPAAVA